MLFISSNTTDHSTAKVIEWLNSLNVPFDRFNGELSITGTSILIEKNSGVSPKN